MVYPSIDDGAAAVYGLNAATVVKTGPGRLVRVIVTTAGSAAGSAYDFNSTTSPQNLIGTLSNAVGVIEFKCPVTNGIVIVPGTAQIVTVTYS